MCNVSMRRSAATSVGIASGGAFSCLDRITLQALRVCLNLLFLIYFYAQT